MPSLDAVAEEPIALKTLRSRRSRSLKDDSDSSSSIDADDFIVPDELQEGELHHLPDNRPPTPERVARRKERKRAFSQVSGNPPSHKLSKAGRRALRRFGLNAGSIHSSSSSSSSARSGSSRFTGVSSISWPRWRFWRDSSSSGSSSSSDSGSEDDESVDTPDPIYTVLVPSLSTAPVHALHPSHVNPLAFQTTHSSNLQDALGYLSEFWAARQDTDPLGGDLGERTSHDAPPRPTRTPLVRPKSSSGVPKYVAAPRRQSHPGSAWWLDILCPSIQDMRQLRKILPLHPLTIEDILHQDPREKLDVFDQALGYNFIVFRAVDESYFRYVDNTADPWYEKLPSHLRTNGRLVLNDGPGAKEGLEGIRVGAINMYIVVYDDGILSFHFEPLDKHIQAVRDKIQRIGALRTVKPQWIAYSLMDSMVDAFFPLMGYLEEELKLIDGFLADPMSAIAHTVSDSLRSHHKFSQRPTLEKQPTWVNFPKWLDWLPSGMWRTSRALVLRGKGGRVARNAVAKPVNIGKAISASMSSTSPFQPKFMLGRVAQSRKMLTVLAKLLFNKADVVRGMRKRNRGEDIALYLGDMEDHIYNLKQSLLFFEVMLNHDHPVLIGLLRLASYAAKNHWARLLARLYVFTVVFLACSICTGCFSFNVEIPHNGDRETHREPDGKMAHPTWFGIVLVIVTCVVSALLWAVRTAWKEVVSRGNRKARGS